MGQSTQCAERDHFNSVLAHFQASSWNAPGLLLTSPLTQILRSSSRVRQLSVVAIAKAVTLPVTSEQAQKMVLVGNTGKFSLVLRQPGKGLSLQTRRMSDDDLGVFVAGRRPGSVICGAESDLVHARKNTKVTIYSVTD